jgi:hypothetical protein
MVNEKRSNPNGGIKVEEQIPNLGSKYRRQQITILFLNRNQKIKDLIGKLPEGTVNLATEKGEPIEGKNNWNNFNYTILPIQSASRHWGVILINRDQKIAFYFLFTAKEQANADITEANSYLGQISALGDDPLDNGKRVSQNSQKDQDIQREIINSRLATAVYIRRILTIIKNNPEFFDGINNEWKKTLRPSLSNFNEELKELLPLFWETIHEQAQLPELKDVSEAYEHLKEVCAQKDQELTKVQAQLATEETKNKDLTEKVKDLAKEINNWLKKYNQVLDENNIKTHTQKPRPELGIFWLIFWAIGGIVPGIIYYIWKKNQQEEWDRENS